jgi:hypothetical protein
MVFNTFCLQFKKNGIRKKINRDNQKHMMIEGNNTARLIPQGMELILVDNQMLNVFYEDGGIDAHSFWVAYFNCQGLFGSMSLVSLVAIVPAGRGSAPGRWRG